MREPLTVWIYVSRILRSLVGVGAIVVAVWLFMYLASTREAPKPRTVVESLPVVRAIKATPKPMARRWTGYGTARAMRASDVAAEVAGRVMARAEHLEAGSRVSQGDVLVSIDATDYQQRLVSAGQQVASIEAQISGLEIEESRLKEQAELLNQELEVARRDLTRAQDALGRGAGNESQVDARLGTVKSATRGLAAVSSQLEVIPSRRASLTASLDAARADLRLAEENVERCLVRAPFDGVVQQLSLEAGEWARIGDVAARVVDLSLIEVPLRLPQAASVVVGDAATLRAEGDSAATWPGAVSRIAPESDASSRSLTVFVEVRQRDGQGVLLRPGQFVLGEVRSGRLDPTLVLPRGSVNVDTVLIATPLDASGPPAPEGAERPMVVREARVSVASHEEGVFADISPHETQWAVLRSDLIDGRGVTAGDLVLVSNLQSLRPGDLVDVRVESDERRASRNGETEEANP